MRALTYIEIDLITCSLTYGVAPCQAELGVTGDKKCFNALATCQDRENFDPIITTLRFAADTDYRPREIEALPSIDGVSITPPKLSLGEDLGQRGSISVTFKDHPHSDTGLDRYLEDRDYDPFSQGTFWGKFRARHPFLHTRPIRLIRGFLPDGGIAETHPQGVPLPSDVLLDQVTRHFLIHEFDGPRPDGTYELVGKDVLRLAEGKRGQAPRVSNGFLSAGISDSDDSATLAPTGIGAAEYPASGFVAIGGEEIVSFTRTGDSLSITRAQHGTTAVAHDAQDRVQLVLIYEAEDPADILYDLFVNYAEIDAEFINLEHWQSETSSIASVYSGVIAEPVSVEKLASEVITAAGLVVWWDDIDRLIRLQVLRAVPPSAQVIDEGLILESTLRTKEQPEKRLSQVWTSFSQRNPLEDLEDSTNYRSTAATIDLKRQSDYAGPAIKKIFTRWISAGGRALAERLNSAILSRFRDPPRVFNFDVFRGAADIRLAGGYRVTFWPLQKDTGERATVPIQVTRIEPQEDRLSVEAEEMLFTASLDTNEHLIIFDASQNNVNLRQVHDLLYGNADAIDLGESPAVFVRCIVESSVIIGSTDAGTPAFILGDWPAGLDVYLEVNGRLQGCGGDGGDGWKGPGGSNAKAGDGGGVALYTRYPIILTSNGEIWGGGGGGGGGGRLDQTGAPDWSRGGGGGGGAGTLGGAGGNGPGTAEDGSSGTADSGGGGGDGAAYGRKGGNGGGPGENGSSGGGAGGGSGGDAGASIDGISFIDVQQSGDHRGPQIN